MSIKLFGYTIGKDKTTAYLPQNNQRRKKASQAIKKQYRRELSYQIKDMKLAERLAGNPDMPNRRMLHNIYYYVLKDLRLKAQIRDAWMKVVGEPWMMYDENETPQEELSKAMRKHWMTQTIKLIALVEFWGYSVPEYDGINPDTFDIQEVNLIPREHISIELQQILIDAEVGGSFIDYSEIAWDLDLVEFFESRDDLGILENIAYNTIWKYYARSDWSRASEKFGMPMMSITADTTNDDELDRLEDRAADFGIDGYIVGQKGDTITIVERKGQRIHDIYKDNIDLCNEENEIGINGQTATTQEKSFVGAAEVQERKFEDLTLTRLGFVKNQINEKFLPYLRYKGFKIPENYTFDYPALINDRNKKLQGKQIDTDPIDADTSKTNPKQEADEETND